MSDLQTVRWGILGPGGIAETFTKDLMVDPTTRDVVSVRHTVAAVASSSSKERALEFITKCQCSSSTKAYGSYADLMKDPDVDVIYIATPHSHHHEHAMMCLDAGKHVLCEKPVTVNAEQARSLVEKARLKGVFFMQGLWTRYLPPAIYVNEIIRSGRLGTIYRCISDTSIATNPEKSYPDGTHRMVNPNLAGGSLLDLGVYSLSWCFQVALASGGDVGSAKLLSAVKPYSTGVDETTTMILTFPRPSHSGGDLHAIAMSSMRVSSGQTTAGACVRIQGDKGEIQVFPPSFRPTKVRIVLADGSVEDKEWTYPGPGKGSGWFNGFAGSNLEGEGHGMYWEADEVAYALQEGRKEGSLETSEEMLRLMEVMDEGGLHS